MFYEGRTLLGLLLAVIALVCMGACRQEALFQDRFRKSDFRMSYAERLRVEGAAPIVVVGRVLDSGSLGRPHPSIGDPRVIVQLTRIRLDVEQVINGGVSSPMEFYCYVFSSANRRDLGVPHYVPVIGQRRIFFLEPFMHGYRAVGDVLDYSLQVFTGYHPKGFCHDKEPGCCIAEMLLVPQPDVDREWFLAYLNEAHYAARLLCSKGVAMRLMNALEQSPDKQIADAARQALWADSH